MHHRIVLLGPTGTDKASVAASMQETLKQKHNHDFRVVDFEKEYFPESMHYRDWPSFLTLSENVQHQIWYDAWDSFSKTLSKKPEDGYPTILMLHGVYVRENYGIRSTLDFANICSVFRPTLIITLLRDIYEMWWLTEKRSDGELVKGQPTFEQLLLARRTEIFLGDLIAFQRCLKKPARHVICSVNHPREVLVNVVFFDAKIVYLSFPITAALQLAAEGKNGFVDEINNLHKLAVHQMQTNPMVVFVSPLTIDELPFRKMAIKAINDEQPTFSFDPKERWSLVDLWGNTPLLLTSSPESVPIPTSQLQNTHDLIYTDLGWRDYKLVTQSHALAILCPKPPNRSDITHGVKGEWMKAVEESITCYVYQKPEWDKKQKLSDYIGSPGSMGSTTMKSKSVTADSVEQLLAKCTKTD